MSPDVLESTLRTGPKSLIHVLGCQCDHVSIQTTTTHSTEMNSQQETSAGHHISMSEGRQTLVLVVKLYQTNFMLEPKKVDSICGTSVIAGLFTQLFTRVALQLRR